MSTKADRIGMTVFIAVVILSVIMIGVGISGLKLPQWLLVVTTLL